MSDGRIVIETGLDSSGIEAGIGKMKSAVSTGAKIAAAGITAISTAMVGIGAASVKVGTEFETSMAKASTLFGDVQVDTGKLNKDMLTLSKSTGTAAAELGEGLYSALSAGLPVTEDMGSTMQFMEQNAKLAAAGFTDVDTAVGATAKVLNAYKMDVSETDKVHKVLMQTQNKGITTVGELSSVLAQVTPTAAAMNVSFNQVGASLATMTAQGTPTAQATTQLNSLFAELGKSGTQANGALEKATEGTKYAGKGFQQLMAEGVPLNEVMDLMGNYAEKNDKSLLDMFSSIEAGKAALAMSGKNAEQYTQNLAAMGTETDVVGQAYEKMSDTLEFKTNQLKESVKNLGIEFYEGMEGPLKEAVESGIDYISQLTDAFEEGGLEGAVEAAGDIFADLAVKAAEAAPEMIDAAVSMIEAFIKGLIKNKARIGKAALDIAVALANGLIKFLPSRMQKPAQDAVQAITTSLTSGGLKNAIDSVVQLFGNLITIIGNVASNVLPILTSALDFVASNFEKIAPFAIAAMTAILAFKAVTAATTAVTNLAATAQTVFNTVMAANPVTLLVTALAAAVAGYAAFSMMIGDVTSEEEQHIITLQEEADALEQQKQKLLESKSARQEAFSGIEGETNYNQRLYDELQTIVDANGQVKEGYEERAAFITSQLSESLGIEIDLTDDVIQKYGELQESIDAVMQKKKAEAILSAYQEDYNQALKTSTENEKNYSKALSDKSAAEQEYNTAMAEHNKLVQARAEGRAVDSEELMKAGERATYAEQALDLATQKLDSATDVMQENQSVISNYENLKGALEAGTKNVGIELLKSTNNFRTSQNATKEILNQQVTDTEQMLAQRKEAFAAGNQGVTEQMVADANTMVALSKLEYAKLTPATTEEIAKWEATVNAYIESTDTSSTTKQKGKEATEGAVEGLKEGEPEVKQTSSENIDGINEGAESVNTTDISAQKAQEAVDASKTTLENGTGVVEQAGGKLAQANNDGLESVDTTSVASSVGSETVQALTDALNNLKGSVETAAKAITESFTGGIESGAGEAEGSGTKLAEAASEGLQSVEATKAGEQMGQQYITGISSKDAYPSGESLGKAAKKGLESVKGDSVGADFAQGYINGMNNKSSDVQQAAANLARQALNAVKNTQASASPSKKTKKLAKDFVDGYSGEMKDRVGDVQKAASDLATAALKELLKANGNYEDIGEQAVESYESGMKAAVTSSENKVEKILDQEVSKAIQARKKQIKAANKALRKTITKENKKTVESKIKENNKDLKTFQDNYKKMGKAALKAYQDALEDEAKKVQESLSDTIDKITKEYQEKYDDVISLRDSMSGKLSDTDLFEKKDDEVILTNLEDEIAAIAKYDASMSRLKGRISEDLLQEIAGMSREDALAYTDALLAMSEQELSRYSALYDKKNADAKAVAQKFYQDQLDTIQTEFTGKINGAFASAQKEMEDIGKNVAQGFVKGLKSQTKSLTAAVKSMSKSIIKQVKKDFGIKSPSKEFARIAEYCTEGYEKQYTRGMGEARKTVSKAGQGVLDTARKSLDYSALAAKMRAGIQSVNARAGEALAATVNYKVSGVAQVEAENAGRERTKLAGEIVDAFVRAGIGVKVGNREFGRLVREVM